MVNEGRAIVQSGWDDAKQSEEMRIPWVRLRHKATGIATGRDVPWLPLYCFFSTAVPFSSDRIAPSSFGSPPP